MLECVLDLWYYIQSCTCQDIHTTPLTLLKAWVLLNGNLGIQWWQNHQRAHISDCCYLHFGTSQVKDWPGYFTSYCFFTWSISLGWSCIQEEPAWTLRCRDCRWFGDAVTSKCPWMKLVKELQRQFSSVCEMPAFWESCLSHCGCLAPLRNSRENGSIYSCCLGWG